MSSGWARVKLGAGLPTLVVHGAPAPAHGPTEGLLKLASVQFQQTCGRMRRHARQTGPRLSREAFHNAVGSAATIGSRNQP